MRSAFVCALLISAGCAASNSVQVDETAAGDSVLEVVVANQQSASASVLNDAGAAMQSVAVGSGPHEAAVSPDGRVAVVTIYGTQIAGNQLAVIDLERDVVVRTIDLGEYARPHGVTFVAGSSERVAVSSEASQNVVLVNVASGIIEAAVPTNARASHMVAVTADGTRAYTANVIDDNVSELDLTSRTFSRKFAVPARPEGIAVLPNGREVWVGSNQTGAVSVIDTQTGRVEHTLTGITFPYRLTASPKGEVMAIVDGQGNRVFFADVSEHRIVGSVDLASPRGVAFSPDGRNAYVTLGGGTLAVIDVAARTVTRSFNVEASPDGVGVGVRRVR